MNSYKEIKNKKIEEKVYIDKSHKVFYYENDTKIRMLLIGCGELYVVVNKI